jgi:superoxide dismutase, Cu-Zn family
MNNKILNNKISQFLLPLLILSLFISISLNKNNKAHNDSALAIIKKIKNDRIIGYVKFTRTDQGIKVKLDLSHLEDGKYAFHIHEFGTVRGEDLKFNAKLAGGHFNPYNTDHGNRTDKIRHVGDLGNIEVIDGKAEIEFTDEIISFSGKSNIIGRAIIIHEKADDFKGPTGNAGPRMAYGQIMIGG